MKTKHMTRMTVLIIAIMLTAVFNVTPASATPTCSFLIAGGGNVKSEICVGWVTVCNDGNNLYVTYTTRWGWMLAETHVAVATSLAGIPQRNGNPVPGRFPYGTEHGPGVTSFTYTIPLGDWGPCTDLVIATHASVYREIGDCCDGCEIQEETAWGCGCPFPGSNWAMYFPYHVQSE